MDLLKEVFGSSEPKPESKVQPKAVPKVETKPVLKVELKPVTKLEPKSEPKPEPKAQPVDNDKLQQLQQELKQAERDYMWATMMLIDAKRRYTLLSNGYKRDPEHSSKEVVYQTSENVADCQERQDKIDRKRNSLKKQIAELKGGVTS